MTILMSNVKDFQKEKEELWVHLAVWCCHYLVKLRYLLVQFQVVFVVPLAEWYNPLGLCQDHNSEAENMLRNQGLNQLEGLGTFEIKNKWEFKSSRNKASNLPISLHLARKVGHLYIAWSIAPYFWVCIVERKKTSQ